MKKSRIKKNFTLFLGLLILVACSPKYTTALEYQTVEYEGFEYKIPKYLRKLPDILNDSKAFGRDKSLGGVDNILFLVKPIKVIDSSVDINDKNSIKKAYPDSTKYSIKKGTDFILKENHDSGDINKVNSIMGFRQIGEFIVQIHAFDELSMKEINYMMQEIKKK